MSREQVAATLASDRWSEERMKAALGAAEEVLRREISDAAAVDHFHEGLLGVGRAAVEDGTPQRVEDAIVAAHPDTPLREEAFRFAWLALRDELGRRGDKPAHSGSLSAETWAFPARSAEGRGAPEQLEGVAALFAAGPRVVLVRGARTGGFLAAVRRSLLHRHGAEALVPPVFPGARDDVVDLLRPYVERADLGEELNAVLPRLGHGEDLVGLLGRAGENQPVALLVDDAHIQARSLLLGLPLYLEPSASRDALLVLGAPAELPAQGPLSDLLEDARDREILTVVELTAPDPSRAEDARLPEHPGALRALAVAALASTAWPSVGFSDTTRIGSKTSCTTRTTRWTAPRSVGARRWSQPSGGCGPTSPMAFTRSSDSPPTCRRMRSWPHSTTPTDDRWPAGSETRSSPLTALRRPGKWPTCSGVWTA